MKITSFYNIDIVYRVLIAKDVYHLHASGMAPSELIYGCFNIDCYVSMDMKKCQSRQPGCRHGSSEGSEVSESEGGARAP